MTHDAAITSPPRYALGLTGSSLSPDLARRLNTRVVNIAARDIGGRSRGTPLVSLHYVAGTATIYNLYLMHCAEFLDARVRVASGATNDCHRSELPEYRNAPSLETGAG